VATPLGAQHLVGPGLQGAEEQPSPALPLLREDEGVVGGRDRHVDVQAAALRHLRAREGRGGARSAEPSDIFPRSGSNLTLELVAPHTKTWMEACEELWTKQACFFRGFFVSGAPNAKMIYDLTLLLSSPSQITIMVDT